MHPLIIQQLAAEHIGEMHAKAENDRLGHQARQARRARRARRRAQSMRRHPASGMLNDDDPRLDAGQRPASNEQPSAPPLPVMAGSRPDAGDASTRREALDHSH
jgi:hypothetical protein